MSHTTRPFRVLGLQQVAIGGLETAALTRLWIDLLGVPRIGSYRNDADNVDEEILALGRGPLGVEVDLMRPLDPEGRPKVHVPALNHIGLWVDDLPAAAEWLSARGVRFTPGGIRAGASGHDICFIHPKADEGHPVSGQGVLIELVQAPAQVIAAHAALDTPR